MCVTICGIFCPDEGAVAGYGNWIRAKYTAKWGVQIVGMIFQTRSRAVRHNSGHMLFSSLLPADCICSRWNQWVHNVYSWAGHFRSALNGDEIHCLRRLNIEGSPEMFSRSWQLARRSVATTCDEYTLWTHVLVTTASLSPATIYYDKEKTD